MGTCRIKKRGKISLLKKLISDKLFGEGSIRILFFWYEGNEFSANYTTCDPMPVCWKLNDCAVTLGFTTLCCLMFLTRMGVCSAVSWSWLSASDSSSASTSILFFHCFHLETGSPLAVKAFVLIFSCIISLLDDWVCRPVYQVWLHWSLRPSSVASLPYC